MDTRKKRALKASAVVMTAMIASGMETQTRAVRPRSVTTIDMASLAV